MNAVNKDLFIPNVEKNAVFDMHKQTQETICIHHFFYIYRHNHFEY